MSSENGWEPAKASPDQCEWVTVPGTSPPVRLQLLKGWPLQIMRAYAADYNAYVEHLRDADSAAWTPTNAVATSNHLNATAMDLNWDSHPFRVADAGYTPQMIDTMNQLLGFYEDTMFWANNWDSPKDAMHHQMGYGTYNNPRTQDFINRKIRSDGFSTFRRGTVVLPSPPMLSRADRYALAIIAEGQKRGISARGIQIALSVALVETNLTMYSNSNVAGSQALPHDAVGHDHDSTGLFQQRQAWGPLECTMDPACSAGLFFDGGHAGQRGLTDFDYNDTTVSPGTWAQRVQVSAFPDRYDRRMPEAVGLYNRLTTIPGAMLPQPAPQPLPGQEDFLSALSPDEQRALYNEIMAQRPSRSALRALGQGNVDDAMGMLLNTDGSVFVLYAMELAKLGHPSTLALLHQIAEADPVQYPDRQEDKELAQAILASLSHDTKPPAGTPITAPPPPVPVYVPPPPPPVVVYTPPPPQVEPPPPPQPVAPSEPIEGVVVDDQPALGSNWKSPVIDSLNMLLKFESDIPAEAVDAAEKLIVALSK